VETPRRREWRRRPGPHCDWTDRKTRPSGGRSRGNAGLLWPIGPPRSLGSRSRSRCACNYAFERCPRALWPAESLLFSYVLLLYCRRNRKRSEESGPRAANPQWSTVYQAALSPPTAPRHLLYKARARPRTIRSLAARARPSARAPNTHITHPGPGWASATLTSLTASVGHTYTPCHTSHHL